MEPEANSKYMLGKPVEKNLVLYCTVLSGGKVKELAFAVKVDELQVGNFQFDKNILPGKLKLLQ